jgi:hypothetical protein
MSRKIQAAILALCLLILVGIQSLPPVLADTPLLEITVSRYDLTAGEENEMRIDIENIGDATAYDVKVRLTVPSTVTGISIVEDSYVVYERIRVDQTRSMYPTIYVARDCPIGAYSLSLELEYIDSADSVYTDSMQIGVNVDAVKPLEVALSVDVENYRVIAGTENEIQLTVTNVGEEAVYNIKAVLTSTSPDIIVLRETSYLFTEIDVDDDVDFQPLLGISQEVSLGAYALSLTLDYQDAQGVTYRDETTVGIFVDTVFSQRLTFKANLDRYTVTAGTENEIVVYVTNTGDTPVYDIDLRLTSTSPEIVVLDETSSVFDVIDINSSVYFTPVLGVSVNAPFGVYSLTLSLVYDDPNGVVHTDSLIVGVSVDSVKPAERTKIALQNVQITPSQVFPGSDATVDIDLKNWGTNAYEVQLQLIIDSSSPVVSLNPTLVFVGDLGSNQTAHVTYILRISGDADASLYTLQLSVSYYNVDNQPESFSEAISIAVHSLVDFRLLDMQPSNITATPGDTVTIEADLLLLGTEPIDFVEIEIVENRSLGPFLTIPGSYEYIGRIDPDSPVLFTIQFLVDSDAMPGTYPLQMKIRGWDGYNRQRQVIIEMPVVVKEFTNPNEGASPTLLELLGLILRVLFGVTP